MAVTPFDEIPKKAFLARMIGPCIGIWFLGWLGVGVISNSTSFQESKGPSAVLPVWEVSTQHYLILIKTIVDAPSVCWSGTEVNDFQKSQCNRLWANLFKWGGLGLLPFACVALFCYMGIETLNGAFRKVRKKIRLGKVALSGVVTNPPDAPADRYSWFYCLKPVTIQLKDKTQLTVYLPLEAPAVSPGQTLIVFDGGKVFGQKRYLAMLYTPHVAVVRGS